MTMSTQEHIVAVADSIVRSRGFNGFSYADIAGELGVSKASLHHHFPTKGDLGLALIDTFSVALNESLEEIDRLHASELVKLREYLRFYEASLEENKMCLCGMLAVEHETLTEPMRNAINQFFVEHETWLECVFEPG